MEKRSTEPRSSPTGAGPIVFDAVTAAELRCRDDEKQQGLKRDLENLFRGGFPRMPDGEIQDWIEDYFRMPSGGFQRHAFLLWNEARRLVGATLFDQGEIACRGRVLRGVYILDRTVLPAYQHAGLGRRMATSILAQLQPDVLMTTCTQSAPLYSWMALVRDTFSGELEVFPRYENEMPVTFPLEGLDFAVSLFRQFYGGVVYGDQDLVGRAVAGLTVFLVRKGIYEERYDFSPWQREGIKDVLAQALGAGPGDGILLMILRRDLRASYCS
jgi:hypothetical protein